METDNDKAEKIIDIVCAIDISRWHFNDYGNSTSFCETEFNNAKIKIKLYERPDATRCAIINIDGIEFFNYDKGVAKYKAITSIYYAQKEIQKANEVTNIYNKLIQK